MARVEYLINKFKIVSTNELLESFNHKTTPIRCGVIITVDDGYRDFYLYAFPILKTLGLSATVFLATDFIENRSWLWHDKIKFVLRKTHCDSITLRVGENWRRFGLDNEAKKHSAQIAIFNYCRSLDEKVKENFITELGKQLKVGVPDEVTEEYAPLSWNEIKEMSDCGICFGSHTVTHPILSKLRNKRIEEEVAISKKIIERYIDREVLAFAYPNGREEDYDNRVVEKLRDNGYLCAMTTVSGLNTMKGDPFRLKRIGGGDASINYFKKLVTFGR